MTRRSKNGRAFGAEFAVDAARTHPLGVPPRNDS